MLQPGDDAPTFTLATDGDGTLDSADLKGQPYVLYFYPRDNTPGCTQEGCAFRDNFSRVTAVGGTVLGVSSDSAAKHTKFKAKHDFPFPLLADEDLVLHNAYGAWGPKKFMGREFDGTIRSTFIIGADGKIARAWPKVKLKGHVDEVITALEELAG
ncbi:MAG: thioredoxin-dependent thiol peroxidase [Myxococcota bacterium]|nr:thioredoxin-dependent thiol peroxidase [Myxococcota bacterium]